MLQYLIKFSISLAVLFIFYRAFLRPLTFYQCNRFYLLGYSLLSFAIPFIDISSLLPPNSHPQLVSFIPSISYYYNATGNTAPAPQASFLQQLTATDWLLLAFGAGVVFMLVRLVGQYLSLRHIRRTAVLLDRDAGIQLYETTDAISPFSFGNAIYFNRQLHTEEELQRIIQHEFVHVKQKHTIDLLVGELLCVVNWFNPFAWMIRYSIRQNLEFIADNNVVATGLDKKEYQYLLLKVVGVPQYSIANNFNFSNLKKRIAMMNKIKSAKMHLTKFLFVLPLLVVLLLAFRKNDHKIAPPVTPASISTLTDTIPPPPPPLPVIQPAKITMDIAPQTVNQQGYTISIADNHGECIVVIKDKSQKIVKAQSLADWNKDKAANENQYGMIPSLPAPPPPPLPEVVNIDAAPAVPRSPRVMLDYAPLGPSVVSIADNLPPDVKVIATESSIDKKNGTKTNIATVTFKNGKKEFFDLDKPGERSKFIERYGKHGELRFQADTMPRPPASGDAAKAPLFVVDGIERPDIDMANANGLPPNSIKVMNVLKGNIATIKYGDRGKNGVVEITTRPPLYIVDSIVQPPSFIIKTIDPVKIQSVNVLKNKNATDKYGYNAMGGAIEIRTKRDTGYFPKDVLVIIDGKEIPAGAKTDEYVKSENIESMHVLKGKEATDKYGEKGKHGVIEIKTKTPVKPAIPVTANATSTWKDKENNNKFDGDGNSGGATIEGKMTANIIYIKKPHLIVTGGSVSTKGKTMEVEGGLSFERGFAEMPLVLYNGKEIIDTNSFKVAKANYKLLSIDEAQAISKYGSKAKYGALDIKTL